jgi:hypothetical protein
LVIICGDEDGDVWLETSAPSAEETSNIAQDTPDKWLLLSFQGIPIRGWSWIGTVFTTATRRTSARVVAVRGDGRATSQAKRQSTSRRPEASRTGCVARRQDFAQRRQLTCQTGTTRHFHCTLVEEHVHHDVDMRSKTVAGWESNTSSANHGVTIMVVRSSLDLWPL